MKNQEDQNNDEPHIKIFNEEIGSNNNEGHVKKHKIESCEKHCCGYKNKHKGSGIFGLIILFSGVLLLFNNLGLVSREIWIFILPFWPVILILLGIKIILGQSIIGRTFSFFIALILLGFIFINAWIHVSGELPNSMRLSPVFVNFINN